MRRERTGIDIEALRRQLEAAIGQELKDGQVTMSVTPEGFVISLKEMGFFDSGQAVLRPGASRQDRADREGAVATWVESAGGRTLGRSTDPYRPVRLKLAAFDGARHGGPDAVDQQIGSRSRQDLAGRIWPVSPHRRQREPGWPKDEPARRPGGRSWSDLASASLSSTEPVRSGSGLAPLPARVHRNYRSTLNCR